MLVDVIDNNQDVVSFLSLRFILDNIILTHESIQWAKELRQDITFVKIDFSKAFDGVHWTSIFNVREVRDV